MHLMNKKKHNTNNKLFFLNIINNLTIKIYESQIFISLYIIP